MSERLNLDGRIYATRKLEDGSTINIRKIKTYRPKPRRTSTHESWHVVASGEIISATIIPSGDALGTTIPVKLTVEGAAAPDAMGCDGTGHDMGLVEHVLKTDRETARSAGRAAVAGRDDEAQEIAITLEERGTIYQSDVERARQRVSDARKGIEDVEGEIIQPDGNVIRLEGRTLAGEFKIHDDLLAKKAA